MEYPHRQLRRKAPSRNPCRTQPAFVTRAAIEPPLTAREREILGYLAEGHNDAFIAEALVISPNMARTHIRNIYRKLDVSSREDILRLTRP